MRRQRHVLKLQKLEVGRGRLDREGFERRAAQTARFQRIRQRVLIDQGSARGVDEIGFYGDTCMIAF